MSKQEITDKIFEIICKKFQIEKEEVALESTFHTLGADSIDAIEVIFIIERDFEIWVPENIGIEFISIASIVDYIDELMFINKNK